ncbi:MAG TPA: IS1595 family transposase [Terriglobales bacterium]|nr:IS1595 family transposase [Terriglobales bacterium]
MDKPLTLQQAIKHYSDEQACIDAVAKMRWPDGVPVCPACGHKEHYYLKTQRRWKCKECYKQFSVKLDTVFEESPLPLTKWLPALWMLCNCKNGISSYELSRDLGVSQKAAWFMLQRLRLALQDGSLVKIGGSGAEVEVDETFIGGKARNMHKSRRIKTKVREGNWGKTVVMGMLERGGHVKAKVVPNRRKPALHAAVAENVATGTQLYTDEHNGYMDMSPEYVHSVVNHLENYVDGRIHTNGMENFWSLLKRGLNGTYVAVEPFHLFRYVDEQVFRYNHRKGADGSKMSDSDRFQLALSQIAGKRLTFAEVTGKVGETAF